MLELFLLGQAGVFIHYLKEWVIANKADKEYNFKKAIPTAALSSICTALLVYLHEDIADLYPVTKFSALILGYMGNSIFFTFVDVKKPKIGTPESEV